ncbi:progestin and adipoQ receptor family member 3-like [Orbicella faveolata]|uniref:progestin and adipoQ receptor family member 3-like n=1 Tax=Orbicella faveolata TaxID=48498 RepID=UPI0009E20136|nr:progestin and adipoQ receptor family member 3-like [Orbicella faveolata]
MSSFQIDLNERGFTTDSKSSFLLESKVVKLYDYHDVPYFLRGNPYITSGYRAFLSVRMCMKSLFVLSNESINIWSHLVGFLYFFYLLLVDNLVRIPDHNGTFSDHAVLTSLLIGYMISMFFSAFYHLFCCHSEKMFHLWLSLDLAGISLGVCACYIPAVYYAFYCHATWRGFYLGGVIFLTLVSLALQFHPSFLTSRWAIKRLLLFSSLVAYGVGPSLHWVLLLGGWSDYTVRLFIPKVAVMYLLGVLALGFYALKIPERYFPGKLNYIGSSHQWWHLFILLAFYWWHRSNVIYMKYRLKYQCSTHYELPSSDVPFEL